MQPAKAQNPQQNPPVRQRPPQGALVPARVASIPIEPPHPREVEDKLEFRSAAQYKKAIAVAERYLWQARLAVDRRIASVKKAERQALVDHEETAGNYQRQLNQAQSRYKQLIDQVHAKGRQTVYQARLSASQAEEVYKEALRLVPGYGALQLQVMSLNDARSVTISLVTAYKSSLGPDGLGKLDTFLIGLDKAIDLARDRGTVVPMQFAEALLKAVVLRQARNFAADKGEVDRIKASAGSRLAAIQNFLHENRTDVTPASIRADYFAVHEWLTKAKGTPFDLALDRLKRDVETTARKEQQSLESRIELAIQHSNHMHIVRPVAEAYDRAQRVLMSSEHAARNVLHQEVARIELQLEKEIQMADAMVVGMDHTAAQRLAEAKRLHLGARKMVGRWSRVLDELEEIGGWQRFIWRMTENFDHEAHWLEVRTKMMARP